MRLMRRISVMAIVVCLVQPALVRAQYNTQLPTTGGISGAVAPSRQVADLPVAVNDSFVGFLDSAVPRSTTGLRFDSFMYNLQPSRAEYILPKPGFLGGRGFAQPETRVDYYDLTSFAEYSWTPWFSVFIEGSYRWLNPDVNGYTTGTGDMRYGLKLCTWSSDQTIATILLRLYQPSGGGNLGTGHWSIEPGLLVAYRFNSKIQFEGEFRYWTPLGGSDFAGNILRYGLGVSYGQRRNGFWVVPVLEGVGWSVLSGQSLIASSADTFEIRSAQDQTIFNAYLGVRVGYGRNADLFVGYGRSFTGDFWQRDTYRIELRYVY